VAIGIDAGGAITTGDSNVLIGSYCTTSATTASQNTIVGYNSGNGISTNGACIAIGRGNTLNAASSYEYVIGSDVTGVGGNSVTIGKDTVNRIWNGYTSNATWTRSSDERLKKDIQTNTDCGLDFVNDLRTVTFKWKAPSELPQDLDAYNPDKTEADHTDKLYGFVAQEVKQVLDNHNITDFNGWTQDTTSTDIQGISYEMFVIPLVKAVQELSAKCDSLQSEIETLKGN